MHCGNFIRIVAHGPLGNNSQSEHIIQQMNPAKTKDQARLGEHGPLILTSFPSFPGLESLGEGGGGQNTDVLYGDAPPKVQTFTF